MAYVLCTGNDDSLLATRRLVLERAGHTVVTTSSEREVIAACKAQQFDVAVIGQSVSGKEKMRIAGLVRQYCKKVKILELVPLHEHKAVQDADAWLDVPTDLPPHFAESVSALAQSPGRGEQA